jgi:hypothetical protein
MSDDPQTSPVRTNATSFQALLIVAVLTDLGIAWVRTSQHFTVPTLVFRLIETGIKLSVLALVLRGKRWAYVAQMCLSALAFVSGIALLNQANHRAAGDPLVWISLAAQVFAGIYCGFRLGTRE